MRRHTRLMATALGGLTAVALVATGTLAQASPGTPAQAGAPAPAKIPTATGTGGAVATVDADATRVGLKVLRKGGNAVDAAVAAAATLGVTEPYSAGLGGGGFFVYYDAKRHRVQTVDGRETAPAAMRADSFQDGGRAIGFDDAVSSGLSVGVPGTPATWQQVLDRWGTLSLRTALKGATAVARDGFVVDQTFTDQTAANTKRFADFTSTKALYLPGGQPPAVGALFTNPDLAATYDRLGRRGVDWLYRGRLGAEIVATVRRPPVAPGTSRTVRTGLMTTQDLKRYDAVRRTPTRVGYRGRDVFGMAPSSSGGSTVGEALNILERSDLRAEDRTTALHRYLEASALAFADRNAYVGDPAHVRVPLRQLLSDRFAGERSCQIRPTAAAKPVAPGVPDGRYASCGDPASATAAGDHEGRSTTHLVTADRWGNVASYTLTIEQTGGSGIVVPGRGFLLNNELTDFNFTALAPGDPNLPAGGKRPRSSMSPTIVLKHGRPWLAVGSPGGSTIITTVLQTLVNRIDLGRTLPQAIAAPRASQRNTETVQAEPAFDQVPLAALGHSFVAPPSPGEIGAATGLELLGHGRLLAAAEPVRRGGGSAGVVDPGR